MNIYNGVTRSHLAEKDPKKLQNIQNTYEEAANNLCLGLKAIGSIMFWAADNENYPAEEAKGDMYRLGSMLSVLSDVIRGFEDTAGDALFNKLSAEMQSKMEAKK
ncbi:TPA: ubiquinol-cytochrome C reductase [Kluyvera intermedia]|nr:ubiquinol-cytochrome C reductase [Kluyvera intermedia]